MLYRIVKTDFSDIRDLSACQGLSGKQIASGYYLICSLHFRKKALHRFR